MMSFDPWILMNLSGLCFQLHFRREAKDKRGLKVFLDSLDIRVTARQ